jgi:hypothetical protein
MGWTQNMEGVTAYVALSTLPFVMLMLKTGIAVVVMGLKEMVETVTWDEPSCQLSVRVVVRGGQLSVVVPGSLYGGRTPTHGAAHPKPGIWVGFVHIPPSMYTGSPLPPLAT